NETDPTFNVIDDSGKTVTLDRSKLLVKPDRSRVVLNDGRKVDVHAVKVVPGEPRNHWPLLVSKPRNLLDRYFDKHSESVEVVQPNQVAGSYEVNVPYQILEIG